MIYFVLFLLLVGAWQAFMKGSKSEVISGISLWLALIFLVIGLIFKQIELAVVLFGIFTFVSILVLMQIYRFSTYHKYFPKMIPVLLVYGTLVGYLLITFDFSKYFAWYVVLSLGFLIVNFRKQQQAKAFTSLAENEEQKKQLTSSISKTVKFHLLSSLVYIVAVVTSFFVFQT